MAAVEAREVENEATVQSIRHQLLLRPSTHVRSLLRRYSNQLEVVYSEQALCLEEGGMKL